MGLEEDIERLKQDTSHLGRATRQEEIAKLEKELERDRREALEYKQRQREAETAMIKARNQTRTSAYKKCCTNLKTCTCKDLKETENFLKQFHVNSRLLSSVSQTIAQRELEQLENDENTALEKFVETFTAQVQANSDINKLRELEEMTRLTVTYFAPFFKTTTQLNKLYEMLVDPQCMRYLEEFDSKYEALKDANENPDSNIEEVLNCVGKLESIYSACTDENKVEINKRFEICVQYLDDYVKKTQDIETLEAIKRPVQDTVGSKHKLCGEIDKKIMHLKCERNIQEFNSKFKALEGASENLAGAISEVLDSVKKLIQICTSSLCTEDDKIKINERLKGFLNYLDDNVNNTDIRAMLNEATTFNDQDKLLEGNKIKPIKRLQSSIEGQPACIRKKVAAAKQALSSVAKRLRPGRAKNKGLTPG